MTPGEIVGGLLHLNLIAAFGVAIVLVLRLPIRRLFGARVTYGLWGVAPLTVLAGLAPKLAPGLAAPLSMPDVGLAAPVEAIASRASAPVVAASGAPSLDVLFIALWLTGAVAMLLLLARRQGRFTRLAAQGRAGPAVCGFLIPRVIVPADFDQRFDAPERELVLAHEHIHLRRHDARINALTALIQCACWFNPMVHLAARYLRIDQEHACDAVVAARFPQGRGHYAQAMLKTQLATTPLPLGCYWPAEASHPLTKRIKMLTHPSPTVRRRALGFALVAALTAASGYAVWAQSPATTAVPVVSIQSAVTAALTTPGKPKVGKLAPAPTAISAKTGVAPSEPLPRSCPPGACTPEQLQAVVMARANQTLAVAQDPSDPVRSWPRLRAAIIPSGINSMSFEVVTADGRDIFVPGGPNMYPVAGGNPLTQGLPDVQGFVTHVIVQEGDNLRVFTRLSLDTGMVDGGSVIIPSTGGAATAALPGGGFLTVTIGGAHELSPTDMAGLQTIVQNMNGNLRY